MYLLVHKVLVRPDAKKGTTTGKRDWDKPENPIGYVKCEFHSATLNNGEAGACTIYLSHDKKGIWAHYVDDARYQEPPKSTLACIYHFFWNEIVAEMKAAMLREKGIKL